VISLIEGEFETPLEEVEDACQQVS